MTSSKWQNLITSAAMEGATTQVLSDLAVDCAYMDSGHIDQYANMIYDDRGAPVGVLNMAGEDAAMVRIVMDPIAARKIGATDEHESLSGICEEVVTSLRNTQRLESCIGYDLVHPNGATPVLYFDFRGESARADAHLFYQQVQSGIEQRQAKSGPAR